MGVIDECFIQNPYMPQPLPLTLPESLNLLTYSKILQLEKASDHSHSNNEVRQKKLICARILGYLIREGPSTKAKERVAQEVNSCLDDDQMDKLGVMYYEHYIRICEPPSFVIIAFFLILDSQEVQRRHP